MEDEYENKDFKLLSNDLGSQLLASLYMVLLITMLNITRTQDILVGRNEWLVHWLTYNENYGVQGFFPPKIILIKQDVINTYFPVYSYVTIKWL